MSLKPHLLKAWDTFMEMLCGYAVIGRLNLSPQLIPVL